ncbi:hypothetical protein ASF65_11530 [Aureimonas sp. Leaf324]|nr:hypothetical protein ASF65_11530 [Aureimonas sp. Leaf324]
MSAAFHSARSFWMRPAWLPAAGLAATASSRVANSLVSASTRSDAPWIACASPSTTAETAAKRARSRPEAMSPARAASLRAPDASKPDFSPARSASSGSTAAPTSRIALSPAALSARSRRERASSTTERAFTTAGARSAAALRPSSSKVPSISALWCSMSCQFCCTAPFSFAISAASVERRMPTSARRVSIIATFISMSLPSWRKGPAAKSAIDWLVWPRLEMPK